MQYIKKGVKVLSDLKNANMLGCIFAHENNITTYALEHLTPAAYIEYIKIHGTFNGHVTHSVLDICMHHPQGTSVPFQSYWEKTQETCDQDACDKQDKYDSDNFHPTHSISSPDPSMPQRPIACACMQALPLLPQVGPHLHHLPNVPVPIPRAL